MSNNKIRNRDNTKNENYFQAIDSEEKAYFLGFMLADGNISKKTNRICFTINDNDSYILEKFKKSINSENEVRHYKVFDNRKNKYNNSAVFQVSSSKIKKDLENLGISSNKTKTFDFTKIIDNKNYNHFLRGLFDGDGHINKTKTRISVISTREFLDYINLSFFKKDYLIIGICAEKNVNRLCVQNKNDCIKFLDFIYKDATIFLERKYNLYQNLKKMKIYHSSIHTECVLIDKNGEQSKFSSIKDAAKSIGIDSGSLITGIKLRGHYKGYKLIRVRRNSVKTLL